MDFPASDLEQNVALANSAISCGCIIENLGYFRRRSSLRFRCLHQVRANPAMSHFAKAHEIASDFLCRLDWQSVAGRIVFQSERDNADDFALHIEERCARLPALSCEVYPQMRGMKIIAEIFSIKPADQPEAGRFRQIQRIPDRNDRGGDLHVFGLANRQRRRSCVDFENGDPASYIRHELAGWQLFPIELNRKIAALAPNRIRSVNRARWIDEKAGAG